MNTTFSNSTIELTSKIRTGFLAMIENLSIEQLNKIPDGFNNNIIWNFGHIIVTQQMLTYGMSGLSLNVNPEMLARYKRGSRPDDFVTVEEFEELKALSQSLLVRTQEDYRADAFKNYVIFKAAILGYEANTLEDVMVFNNYHEGLHFGTMQALRKMV